MSDATAEAPTYYGRPVLKEPVWIWSVPAYFHAGGVAGAAAALGAVAQLAGRPAGLVTAARRLAAAGGLAGTALLVVDLGRPERFLNMLRVVRPTSPMSVGSWTLAAFAPSAALSAAIGRSRVGDASGLAAGVLGLPMSTYAGVLLAATAVPVWRATDRSLPPLFAASSTASAGALLEALAPDPASRAGARRFALIAKLAEVAAMASVRRDVERAGRAGTPLREGLGGALWRAAEVLHAVSLALSVLPGRRRIGRRWADAAVTTAAGMTLRFAVFHAGRASTRDPRATFEQRAD